MQGTTHDLLGIRASDELARALQHPREGKPTCLPAVFHEAVQKKEMVPVKEFLNAKDSIYKTSWIPSPWTVMQWGLRQVLGGQKVPDKLKVGDFVVIKNVEAAADEVLKKMKEHTSTADRVLSRADFLKRFSTTLNPAAPLTMNDLNILLVFLARDKQAISYNAQTIKFKPEHEAVPLPVTEEDAAIANLRDTLANIHAQLPPLMEKITAADAAAREAVAAKQMVRAKAALRSKKLAESALAQRSDVALQLESVYTDLQHAADQVEIVEAMRAGAAALKGLNEKVGGAEGVQGVVDAVNEQMATTEEITNIINETSQPLDEAEIDDEFEALEKAEQEKLEREEAEKTAARLAELDEAERKRKEKEAAEELQKEDAKAEKEVDETSQSFAKLSFQQPNDESEHADEEKRVAIPA
jgi:charged multivesicular body protein 7